VETVFAICLGIGLSAACGFRVFVPMLAAGVATKAGILTLGEDFSWISSIPALVTFAIATLLEIGAYYILWLDNLLDTVSSPAAVIAGTIATAAFLSKTEMSPLLLWSVAIIAGGGSAGIVKGGAATIRAASTATTGGYKLCGVYIGVDRFIRHVDPGDLFTNPCGGCCSGCVLCFDKIHFATIQKDAD